jgi:hypothetical protein
METIQYSLRDNISIDIRFALECSRKKKDIVDPNSIFDKHCLELYGEKTCIIFELENGLYQLRYLNTIDEITIDKAKNINKNDFYIQIPTLVESLYTVVVVEHIKDIGKKEIVAIHSPSNAF